MLQLSVLLVGLCQAHPTPPPGDPPTSQEVGEVPTSQLRMLSLGLAHLLQGVEENAKRLEQQGEQVAAELDGATKSLESLRKQSLQVGRTHRQVRIKTLLWFLTHRPTAFSSFLDVGRAEHSFSSSNLPIIIF